MFSKLWADIQKGKLASVYLLAGLESYYIDETIRRIKDKLEEEGEVESVTIDLDEKPVDLVIDESDTIPFFSSKKLIIAKNASFLKATDKTKEKIQHDLTRLARWLEFPSDTSVTIFIAPYEKLDERKKVTKQMKEHAVYLLAETPKEHDLAVWVQHEVAGFGKLIEDEATAKLIELVGLDMLHLKSEVDKICLYLGEETTITASLVEELVSKTLEQDAFKMLNAYIRHDVSEALSIYHDLIRQKQEPIMLVALLASQIRLMSNVYYLLKKGYHSGQIAKQLKVNPYRIKRIVEDRRNISEEALLKALYGLSEVDLKLKSVSGRRERFLELFLMKPL
ncbi:DNA polymerase III subunit delta [Rummeliibacillus stabekisii]|uniref:DNA polymerase III subunit delta n=1 Tax=Rummeliibacillus stabekisii TaxID=241244 RepID=UPI0011759E0A|nr:DNA polymerase III subunit delta [Rummeliibacillus stabekisii]MBB5169646.1 DNA polymerase-3 subunit delta [Rummeliibacillus stabekisii]MCM3316046.1 DNA polymerase III subunit delta [Rummeliibacillus stabekisii]GEL03903.1 DNA polymerase III subunit delta [Rummeliibacillus stabekisii]